MFNFKKFYNNETQIVWTIKIIMFEISVIFKTWVNLSKSLVSQP